MFFSFTFLRLVMRAAKLHAVSPMHARDPLSPLLLDRARRDVAIGCVRNKSHVQRLRAFAEIVFIDSFSCSIISVSIVQGSAKRRFPGLVNFVTALAYDFCLALPAAFTGDHL